jgi:phosphoglycolate phosphatase-like HAD superfamily hydrolase
MSASAANRRFRLVIFDVDGSLLDTNYLYVAA